MLKSLPGCPSPAKSQNLGLSRVRRSKCCATLLERAPRHGFTANARIHGTTGLIVGEAFTAAKPSLTPLPAIPFRALLKLEQCITKNGRVCREGNIHEVPDGTRNRVVATRSCLSATARDLAAAPLATENAREKELQKDYQTVWPPPPVKHSSWDDDH